MPRSLSTALQAHYQQELVTVTTCVRIARTDGVVFGFTTLDYSITFGGLEYTPIDSVTPSAMRQSASSGVDNLELVGILSSDRISDQDLRDGLYDQAEILMFNVNYMDLSMGSLITFRGTIGEVTMANGGYTAEIFSLTTNLKQQLGDLMSPLCSVKRLGDPQCKVNLLPYRFTGYLTQINAPGSNPTVSLGQSTIYQINSGGGAVGSYQSDTKFHGGRADGRTVTVDLSSVSNPAPQSAYQTERDQVFYYLLDGLTPLSSYDVRLHFAELHWDQAGKRTFQVNINGNTVLYNYDIYARAGGRYIAVVEELESQTTDNLGQIRIDFLTQLDIPKVSALELIQPATPSGNNAESQYLVSGINKPTGYFDYGIMYCYLNDSYLEFEIKQSVAQGSDMLIQLRQAPHRIFPIGTQMILEAGCDRTWSTCKYKFNNAVNFHGFPHLPGTNKMLQVGRGS